MTAPLSSHHSATLSSQTYSKPTTRSVPLFVPGHGSSRSCMKMLRPQDQDGALSQTELDDLFSTSPGNPWAGQGFPDSTITDDMGRVTLQGWLAQWSWVARLCVGL